MSIAEDLLIIAENVPRVHQAGYDRAESVFWDSLQNYGNRKNYEYAFMYWGVEYIRPKYKVVPTSRSMQMFGDNPLLKVVEKKYFDLSNCTISNTSSTSGNYYTFRNCFELQTVEDIGLLAGYYYATFYNCLKLETIDVMRFDEETLITTACFNQCKSLKNITIEGTIGQNGFDISAATGLTKKSITSIINALSESLTATKTITLSKTAVHTQFPNDGSIAGAEWSNADWTTLITPKTQKGWSISLQ